MSRTTARRLTVLTAVSGCLVAAALPGLAQENVPVSVAAQPSERQFEVQKLDGTPLTAIDFGPGGERPFKTVVSDTNIDVASAGYQLAATMTNLYKQTDGQIDYTKQIASGDIALDFATSPLGASPVSLPVSPQVLVSGVLGDCRDADLAAALGIAPLTALLGPLFNILSPLNRVTQDFCRSLQDLGATTSISATVDGALQNLEASLALADLPFALTGGEGGVFTSPSFGAGTVGAGDAASSAGAAPATSLMIMEGADGALSANLADQLDGLLTGLLGPVGAPTPVTSVLGTNALLPLDTVLASLRETSSLLNVVTALAALPVADQVDVINMLDATLADVGLPSLSTVTGNYSGYPILVADPSAAEAGTYVGTMTVDFFQS